MAVLLVAFFWAVLNRLAAWFEVQPGLAYFYPAAALTVLAGAWLRQWGVAAMLLGNLFFPWGEAADGWWRALLFSLPAAVWAGTVALLPRLGSTGEPLRRFLLVGVGGGSVMAAGLGSALLTMVRGSWSWAEFSGALWAWWIPDIAAALAFGIPLVLVVCPERLLSEVELRHWRLWWGQVRNLLQVVALTGASGLAVVLVSYFAGAQVHWLAALLLPALTVAGMRGGVGAGLAANGLVSVVYVVAALLVQGPREADVGALSATYGNVFMFFGFAVFGGVLGGRNRELVELVRRQGEELATGLERTVEALAMAIEARDAGSQARVQRIARLAALVGGELGLAQGELENLRRAAILHNVGRVGVPERITLKASELTPNEVHLIRSRQVELGVEILSRVEFLTPVVDIVRYQKERWDGERSGPHPGYFGLKGEEIPIGARVLAVVLAYDAMTHDRPFRRALSREAAVAELWRCSGTQFDPTVVTAFTRVLREEWDRAVDEAVS